jgi:hypothetical protein
MVTMEKLPQLLKLKWKIKLIKLKTLEGKKTIFF